jgi:hypothetical protein
MQQRPIVGLLLWEVEKIVGGDNKGKEAEHVAQIEIPEWAEPIKGVERGEVKETIGFKCVYWKTTSIYLKICYDA